MSRIGKLPIELPEGVAVKIEPLFLTINGPKGELTCNVVEGFKIEQKEQRIEVTPQSEADSAVKFWGLQRTLIANAIIGVTTGFSKTLEVNGVGYRVALQGNKLVLNLGFSHPIEYIVPEGIELKVEQSNIIVSGIDKQKVGAVAASIREFKKPEPYKGKGIKYSNEVIRRKAGKTAVKAAG
ncbi:50S ribosomal protein L6 [Candidatus Saccharibacteria bacterium]|nr:50S ribosomal protein L6 [Candidatus Saccharibacteria bacterium]